MWAATWSSTFDLPRCLRGECWFLLFFDEPTCSEGSAPPSCPPLFPFACCCSCSFAVKVWVDGEWQFVILDDYIPLDKSSRPLVMEVSNLPSGEGVFAAPSSWFLAGHSAHSRHMDPSCLCTPQMWCGPSSSSRLSPNCVALTRSLSLSLLPPFPTHTLSLTHSRTHLHTP